MEKQDLKDHEESHSDEKKHDKDVTVTVRTPAGASQTFEFKRNERVDKVTREASCTCGRRPTNRWGVRLGARPQQ